MQRFTSFAIEVTLHETDRGRVSLILCIEILAPKDSWKYCEQSAHSR